MSEFFEIAGMVVCGLGLAAFVWLFFALGCAERGFC